MIISQYKTYLESYEGSIRIPDDFQAFWNAKSEEKPSSADWVRLPFANPMAIYEELRLSVKDHAIKARCIRPDTPARHPLILMFHDLNREIRGWHHMTRFIALGYGVIAMDAPVKKEDWKPDPSSINFPGYLQDALILSRYSLTLDWVDTSRVVTWGEGLGGGLALAAASVFPEIGKCCTQNPLPADIPGCCASSSDELDYCDIAAFAPFIKGEVLMGVCLMDTVAPPEGSYAVYNRLTCQKRLKVYPKYLHERVNFFENEFLAFLK